MGIGTAVMYIGSSLWMHYTVDSDYKCAMWSIQWSTRNWRVECTGRWPPLNLWNQQTVQSYVVCASSKLSTCWVLKSYWLLSGDCLQRVASNVKCQLSKLHNPIYLVLLDKNQKEATLCMIASWLTVSQWIYFAIVCCLVRLGVCYWLTEPYDWQAG